MKKFIFTESQLRKLISHQINEQNAMCAQNLFKNATINLAGTNQPESKIRTILQTGKFKVTSINGNVKLNGKPYNNQSVAKGVIITPDTTIEICSGNTIVMSGMGLPQCSITHGENITFTPMVA